MDDVAFPYASRMAPRSHDLLWGRGASAPAAFHAVFCTATHDCHDRHIVITIGARTFPGLAGLALRAYLLHRRGGLGRLCLFPHGWKFDHPTASFAAMPGGSVEMVTLGAERGGYERKISLIHAARIFLVALSLPFLIQLATGHAISGTSSSSRASTSAARIFVSSPLPLMEP